VCTRANVRYQISSTTLRPLYYKKTTHIQEETSKNTKMISPEAKCIADMSHAITPPRTPTAATTSAHKLFVEIQDIHTTLSGLSSLAPGGQVDELLTRLVGLCIETHSAEFISNFFSIHGVSDLCSSLRPLCGAAEGELEKYWAERIIGEAHAQQKKSTHRQ
jgi:nicotianamine synthase